MLVIILYYTILYYTILYYTILYYTILYYTILYYTILYYTILYYTILYYTILYYTILYYTILYYTILYYTILYYTILYYTISPYCSFGSSPHAQAFCLASTDLCGGSSADKPFSFEPLAAIPGLSHRVYSSPLFRRPLSTSSLHGGDFWGLIGVFDSGVGGGSFRGGSCQPHA